PKTGGRSRLGADAADGGPVPRPPPCPSHATAASRPARLNRTDQASEPLLRPHPRGVELAIPVLQDFFKRAGEIRRGRERRQQLAYADETVPVDQRLHRYGLVRVRQLLAALAAKPDLDRKSTRLNSSHVANSYAV